MIKTRTSKEERERELYRDTAESFVNLFLGETFPLQKRSSVNHRRPSNSRVGKELDSVLNLILPYRFRVLKHRLQLCSFATLLNLVRSLCTNNTRKAQPFLGLHTFATRSIINSFRGIEPEIEEFSWGGEGGKSEGGWVC